MGGAIAGVLVLLSIGLLAIFLRRRRRRRAADIIAVMPQPYSALPTMSELSSPVSDFSGVTSKGASPFTPQPSKHVLALGPTSSSTQSFSSVSPSQPSGSTMSLSRVEDLRDEVEILRRAVEELRTERDGMSEDAPPEYR